MPRNIVYMPDNGKGALISFYDWMLHTEHTENGLLNEVFKQIRPVHDQHNRGTVEKQLGVWLKYFDPNIVGLETTRHRIKTYKNGELISVILKASYDSILKKLLDMAFTNTVGNNFKQTWLPKFTDPTSEYYCSKFQKELYTINPILGQVTFKDREKEKAWFIEYMKVAKKQPFATTKFNKEACTLADKKFPLGKKKHRPLNLFREYCLPESEHFDIKCFELCFKSCGYSIDKKDPEQGIKFLITRVLESGHYIDNPAWADWQHNNTNLYFWVDRYTNIESKFYDFTFDQLLKEKFPQQFSKMSLKYKGFRFQDKRKDEFIEKLKLDPTISAKDVARFFQHDDIFKQLVESISVRPSNKVPLMKSELLKRISQGINFNDLTIEINKEKINLRKTLIKFVKSGTKFTDEKFRTEVENIDPILVSCIEEEFSKSTPSGSRLVRTYNKIKSQELDELWFAVSPGWEVLPWLDYENKTTGGKYKSKFDPSFLAEIRIKDNISRDEIRTLWTLKYGTEFPYSTGNDFLMIKGNGRHYTFNLGSSEIYFGKSKTELSNKLGVDTENVTTTVGSSKPQVCCRGKYFGYTYFKARIVPDADTVFEYLNNYKE